MEHVAVDVSCNDHEQQKLSHAFRAQGVDGPAGGDAAALPQELSSRGENPAKGSIVVFCPSVGAQEKALTEGVSVLFRLS